MNEEKKYLAVLMGFNHHILDHIAPLAALLDIPLMITEEKNFSLGKEFYPMVSTFYQDRTNVVYEKMAQEYDVLFRCTFNSARFVSYFAELLGKEVKLIYCPHGNSDKGHLDNSLLEHMKTQDGVLLYGQHMIDRLKQQNHWDSLPPYAITGNYRLEFYLENRTFYQDLMDKKIFSHLPKTTYTLLYAPTWNDYENLSSFFDRVEELIEYLPEDMSLLIKPHPLIEETAPAQFFSVLPEQFPKRVQIVEDFPCMYPLLDRVDAYIGDYSSVGYDALYFEKPLFFFDSLPDNTPDCVKQLHQGGIVLKEEKEQLFPTIENHLRSWNLQSAQKKLYAYAFGPRQSKEDLRSKVFGIL
ncbi:MAG: CDP-glycerol glycerophosphotransferase family protein [Chlamydiota bacterium]